MNINLVDFFIIQAAITIAVHLLEYLNNAAAKLGFVDHGIAIKVEQLKAFFLRFCNA